MSRIPAVLVLLLLSTAASAQFLDFTIQVGPVALPAAGTASSFPVSVSNLSTTPIQPFDLVLTLHGDAALDVPASGTSDSAYSVLAHTTATDGRFTFDLDAMSPGTMLIASAVHRLEGKEWQTELSNRSMVE